MVRAEGSGGEVLMGIYCAQFRWSQPPERATFERYVAVLGQSVGRPCRIDTCREEPDTLSGVFSLPGLSSKDFLKLTRDLCDIEFSWNGFLWAHAAHCIQKLGGVFTCPVVSDRPDWKPRQWRELKWSERVRIRTGFGVSIV